MPNKKNIIQVRFRKSADGKLVYYATHNEITETAKGIVISISDKTEKFIPWSNVEFVIKEEE